MAVEEYLTIKETAARLHLAPKTVRNRMSSGTWRRGVHWFRPANARPAIKWSAIVAWLESKERRPVSNGAAFPADVPAARRRRG